MCTISEVRDLLVLSIPAQIRSHCKGTHQPSRGGRLAVSLTALALCGLFSPRSTRVQSLFVKSQLNVYLFINQYV